MQPTASVVIPTDPASALALQLDDQPRGPAIQALLDSVDYRREPLERARDALVRRLEQRSDDFEATKALRLVYEALARVGWPGQPTVARTPDSRDGVDGHRRERGSLHRLRSAFGR